MRRFRVILNGAILLLVGCEGQQEQAYLGLAKEDAIVVERWLVAEANRLLETELPENRRGTSRTGGWSTTGASNQFEVLTATDIFWWKSVDPLVVETVAHELERLPELQEWINAGRDFGLQRRVEFRVVGPDERPKLRILLLCNNLANGKVSNEKFMTNMWLKNEAEQGVAPQSATRSESDSEGSDNPQPESEARSR
jgi:hypothetical protein